MPDATADCPMAHMIELEDIKKVREEYPDVAVVCYINSTVETVFRCVCNFIQCSEIRRTCQIKYFLYSGSESGKLCGKSGSGKKYYIESGDIARHIIS